MAGDYCPVVAMYLNAAKERDEMAELLKEVKAERADLEKALESARGSPRRHRRKNCKKKH
jgi:hypothetical protein